MIRSQAADYGFQLNEFDPFFNYRATQYLLDHGLDAYVHWHDTMSWYPAGRDVFSSAQVPLHVTDAILYKIFGGGTSLYDFTIIFPVVFGSMTAIVVFALVRVLGGTSAGLFASLFFALSPPIIVRGTIGWFKSEPLGLFYGLLGVYLFLSGLKSKNKKVAIAKLVGGGFFLATGFASWGGIEFFLLPLGLFFVALPFLRKDHNFLIWAVPLFVAVTMIISGGLFARPGPAFVFGVRGLAMSGPAILLVVIILIQKYSREQHRTRNSLLVVAALVIIGSILLSSGVGHAASFRYLNAVNPFLTSQDPLVDSVAEHATPTLAQNFSYFSVLMLFAGLGIWLMFRKRNDDSTLSLRNEMIVFALIIGIVGAYAGSTFSRLELLTATSVIILSSIGLSVLVSDILKRENKSAQIIESPKKGTSQKKGTIQTKKTSDLLGKIPKIAFVVIIVALLLVPAIYPVNANWISITKSPPTILNGGSNFAISTDDWPNALQWIKNNTPKDAVVASWWDYGYWVQTLGERTTLADNATISTEVIANIARMLLASPDEAWKMLKNMGANYVLVYVVGQKFVSSGQPDLYVLGGGGDESKKQWFMKIGGLDSTKFLQDDSFTPTDYFWKNTLLGQMFPFKPMTYFDPNTHTESPTYVSGYTAIYSKTIKYPVDSNGPLRLVYSSPSLDRKDSGVFSGVLIYQVNPDYKSQTTAYNSSSTTTNSSSFTINSSSTKPTSSLSSTGNIAVIDTKYGQIKFKLLDNIAPKTTANFVKLANSGFYDGTVFHRIVPGFVIQGGDPNSIKGARDSWGLGDAGYTIPPEFSSTVHFTKYTVGMARGPTVDSGSSQFFITLNDTPNLDNQYTIFGNVISGQDVVDKIAALKTISGDQPEDAEAARVTKISVELSNSTK